MDEKKSLRELLIEFRDAEDKNECFNIFFGRFEPLLKKYAYKLEEEDAKYMLAEALYRALQKMPPENTRFEQDKCIIKYIQKSIYTEYIKISKFNNKTKQELPFDEENDAFNSLPETVFHTVWDDELLRLIYAALSDSERKCFHLSVVCDYNEIEIANYFSISRQAVHRSITNARAKLRNYLKIII